MWKELTEVLRAIMRQYYEILLLAKQKKAIIVSANMQELNAVVKKEQQAMQHIASLEERRQVVQKELASAKLIASADLSLLEVCSCCDVGTSEELLKLRRAIQQIAADLGSQNKENSELLNKALSFVQFNINMLSQVEVVPTYGVEQSQNKPVQGVIKRTLFDQKI